jgi:Fic family protein
MSKPVTFINSPEVRRGYGPLIRAILAHFCLISIHPFAGGNGRTSRAVEAHLLYQAGNRKRSFNTSAESSLETFTWKRSETGRSTPEA